MRVIFINLWENKSHLSPGNSNKETFVFRLVCDNAHCLPTLKEKGSRLHFLGISFFFLFCPRRAQLNEGKKGDGGGEGPPGPELWFLAPKTILTEGTEVEMAA